MELLDYASNRYSQLGEDGILARLFEVIGETSRVCCEFGAWDGIHFSNTRALLDEGWRGILIESDPDRFTELQRNAPPPHVTINAAVDDRDSTVGRLLAGHGFDGDLDFLSIDIDGEDLYVLRSLAVRPRVICVEANAAHDPEAEEVPRAVAATGVGQPLGCFADAAAALGYRLVTFTGNAIFVREDAGHHDELPTLTARDAYARFLSRLDPAGRFWLYKMNLALESPYHRYANRWLSGRRLRLPLHQAAYARVRAVRRHPSRNRATAC